MFILEIQTNRENNNKSHRTKSGLYGKRETKWKPNTLNWFQFGR